MKKMLFLMPLIFLVACYSTIEKHVAVQGVVIDKLSFLTMDGKSTFEAKQKIWQNDSAFIQEVNTAVSNTTDGIRKTIYEPIFYRYMSIKTKLYFDYYHFSDTAVSFRNNTLPDTFILDNVLNSTINFANERRFPIKSIPRVLGDTIVDKKNYTKVWFQTNFSDTNRVYYIGLIEKGCTNYFRSKESYYSKQLGGCLVCIWEYYDNNTYPSVRSDYEHIADTLTQEELKVFAAWERNAKNYKSP
jgi:hypothetical protein